jgi:hypothetical protein
MRDSLAAMSLRSAKVLCSSASGSCLASSVHVEASSLALILDTVGRVLRGGVDTEKAVKQALREGSRSGALPTGSARGSAATIIFSISLWRARLAYIVGQRTAGRPPRGRAFDALLLMLLLSSPPEGSILEPSPPTAWLPLLQAEAGAEHSGVYLALRASPPMVRWPASPVPRLAIQYSLPCGLVRDWSRRLPAAELQSLAAACNSRAPTTLRTNTELLSRDRLLAALGAAGVHAEAGRWSPLAVRLIGDRSSWGGSAWSLPGWAEAHFELQDEGSQLISRACEAQPGETVLDFCAGRGGKALALAASVGASGRVICHDVDERALRQLVAAAVRTGVGARVSIFAAGDDGSPTIIATEGKNTADRMSRGGSGSIDAAGDAGGGGSSLAGADRPMWAWRPFCNASHWAWMSCLSTLPVPPLESCAGTRGCAGAADGRAGPRGAWRPCSCAFCPRRRRRSPRADGWCMRRARWRLWTMPPRMRLRPGIRSWPRGRLNTMRLGAPWATRSTRTAARSGHTGLARMASLSRDGGGRRRRETGQGEAVHSRRADPGVTPALN